MIKKIKIFSFLSFLYLTLLIAIYWIHITFIKVDVLLYSAIQDVLIATIIFMLFMVIQKKIIVFNLFELLLSSIVFLLVGYILAISIPTIIDRSLSFYLLEKIKQNNGLREESLKSLIQQDYINELKVPEMRITEQLESGTILIKNGCITLTNKGEKISSFSIFFKKYFLPKMRLIKESYSDELNTSQLSINKYHCK